MTRMMLRNQNVFAIQNGVAALLFLFLFLSEGMAYLLGAFPGVEMFWRMSIFTSRISAPLLGGLGQQFSQPFLLLVLLGTAATVPLIAYRHRSWFGTAVCGHVALGLAVMMTSQAMKRAGTGHITASLGDVFDPRMFDTSSVTLAIVASAMAVFCLLNHFAFFVRPAKI